MDKLNSMNKKNNKKLKPFLHGKNCNKQFAFTLIELMITVAIVGILASIAYPSYTSFITSSNRSEGQGELLRFANLQEQYFVDYRTYGTDLKALGKTTVSILTENGHYRIKVANGADASKFVLKAIAKGSQLTNDSACSPLTINQVGKKGPPGCWN
jgi:type IV pilus assembly protein PilE